MPNEQIGRCRKLLTSLKMRVPLQVMKAVIMEDIPLDYGPWRSLSKQGMSLIKRLLCRTPEDRITAEEALHHPWFA